MITGHDVCHEHSCAQTGASLPRLYRQRATRFPPTVSARFSSTLPPVSHTPFVTLLATLQKHSLPPSSNSACTIICSCLLVQTTLQQQKNCPLFSTGDEPMTRQNQHRVSVNMHSIQCCTSRLIKTTVYLKWSRLGLLLSFLVR
jgi:hypothetical protein